MNALHRGDHIQLSEPSNIHGGQVLGMFDAPAQVLLFGVRLKVLSNTSSVSRLARSPIAWTHSCESVLDGQSAQFRGELSNRSGVQPGARRQVGVWFKQPGAARTRKLRQWIS